MKIITYPHARTATIIVVASVLLLAGIATTVNISYAGQGTQGKPLRATGGVLSVLLQPGCTAPSYVGCLSHVHFDDKVINTLTAINIYDGTLVGHATDSRVITIYPGGVSYVTGYGHFVGTLADKEGSFSLVNHFKVDLSAFLAGTGPMTWNGHLTVVDDTGSGGLDGICGGVPYSGGGTPSTGLTTIYDFEFRFGDACNSN